MLFDQNCSVVGIEHTIHKIAIEQSLIDLPPLVLSKMPFVEREHASRTIQEDVGLFVANCRVPRNGDRSANGEQGCNINSSKARMKAFNSAQALRLWNLIPDGAKNDPADLETAQDLSLLAAMAGEPTPQGVQEMTGRRADTANVDFYWTPGGAILEGLTDSSKFISFLNMNMDQQSRVAWSDLTGREQFEWIDVWKDCDKTCERREAHTRGLRGTNLDRIPDVAGVQEAMARSPSLAVRVNENAEDLTEVLPDNHPVVDADWRSAAERRIRRRLF